MKRPTLSVTMANYNHGYCISRAIEAVVSQSRPPDEYIIVDDGSTDNSVSIIESYAHRYPYIRFVKNEYNMGGLTATKLLVSMVTGDYIYSGAADDYIFPGFYEKAMNMAECYPDAGVIFGKVVRVDSEGKEVREIAASHWKTPVFATPEKFLQEYLDAEYAITSPSPAIIYKQNALMEIGGFRPELDFWCDTFAFRAIGLKYGACYIPERLVAHTINFNGFCLSSILDVKKRLDIISRGAWLMRSPEFRAHFPEKHIKCWEKGFRDWTIHRYITHFRELHYEAKKKYNYCLLLGNWMHRLVGFLLLKYTGLGRGMLVGWLRVTLNNYKGDAYCHKNKVTK